MFSKINGYVEWITSFPTILNHDIEVTSLLASAQTDSDDKYSYVSNTVLLQKANDRIVREQFYKVRYFNSLQGFTTTLFIQVPKIITLALNLQFQLFRDTYFYFQYLSRPTKNVCNVAKIFGGHHNIAGGKWIKQCLTHYFIWT